jgi:hypothetical protein
MVPCVLRISLTELMCCRLDAEAYQLVAAFPKMVEFWAGKAEGLGGKVSFQTLRSKFLGEWRKAFEGFYSQYAQTSCMVAVSAMQATKPPEERVKLGRIEASFAVLSPAGLKLYMGELSFPAKVGSLASAELKPLNSLQEKLLEQAENEKWQLGQAVITPRWAILTFTRYLDIESVEDKYIDELLGC